MSTLLEAKPSAALTELTQGATSLTEEQIAAYKKEAWVDPFPDEIEIGILPPEFTCLFAHAWFLDKEIKSVHARMLQTAEEGTSRDAFNIAEERIRLTYVRQHLVNHITHELVIQLKLWRYGPLHAMYERSGGLLCIVSQNEVSELVHEAYNPMSDEDGSVDEEDEELAASEDDGVELGGEESEGEVASAPRKRIVH